MSTRCGQERAAEVVDEEPVNADQNAPYRRELPPVVIASVISVRGRVLRRRQNPR